MVYWFTSTIDDGAMIAANVQLISNNYELYERQVIIPQ